MFESKYQMHIKNEIVNESNLNITIILLIWLRSHTRLSLIKETRLIQYEELRFELWEEVSRGEGL